MTAIAQPHIGAPAELILQRMEKVKSNGKGKWTACCPAHTDKTPSLSITEASDGKVLLHCFSGCETSDVMASIGLEFRDLFPEGLSVTAKLEYRRRSLTAARDHARLIKHIADANIDTLDIEDLLVAAKVEVDLPRLEAELQAIEARDPAKAERNLSAMFSSVQDGTISLPSAIRQTVIGKLAQRTAHCLEFPEASAFLALLGTASASVATSYAVQYRTGSPIPTGLYCVIEQPPATQKSYLLEVGLNAYSKAIRTHNRRISAHNADQEEKGDHLFHAFENTTDATAAALDMALAGCSEGRFVIASAEQSAFASLFPEANSFATTNELALKGYPGEYVSGIRKGRAAFNGMASGSIVLVAQPGSAKRVFSASNGTGLAERFLYLSEATLLGHRALHGEYLTREERADFERACSECVTEYSGRIFSTTDMDGQRIIQDPENLIQLRATPEGYAMILSERRRIEPRLGELQARGEMMLLSWLGKLETHALKIASVLHVIDCRAADCKVPDLIPPSLIRASLDLLFLLGDHLEHLLHESGESGDAAEVEAVFKLVSERRQSVTAVAMQLKNRAPFKAMNKGAYKAAKARIAAMLQGGLLMLNERSELVVV